MVLVFMFPYQPYIQTNREDMFIIWLFGESGIKTRWISCILVSRNHSQWGPMDQQSIFWLQGTLSLNSVRDRSSNIVILDSSFIDGKQPIKYISFFRQIQWNEMKKQWKSSCASLEFHIISEFWLFTIS